MWVSGCAPIILGNLKEKHINLFSLSFNFKKVRKNKNVIREKTFLITNAWIFRTKHVVISASIDQPQYICTL